MSFGQSLKTYFDDQAKSSKEIVDIDDEYGDFVKKRTSSKRRQENFVNDPKEGSHVKKLKKFNATMLEHENIYKGKKSSTKKIFDAASLTDKDEADSVDDLAFSDTLSQGDIMNASEDSEASPGTDTDDLFNSIQKKPETNSLEIFQSQSIEKAGIVKEQLKFIDTAYKLRILLQKLLHIVNSASTFENAPEMISGLDSLSTHIRSLVPGYHKTSQWYAWVEPWYTSTFLSHQLKAANNLKVIGQANYAVSFQNLVALVLEDTAKWSKKSSLHLQKYDDLEFYQGLLKDVLASKCAVNTSALSNNDTSKLKKAEYTKEHKFHRFMNKVHEKIANFMAPHVYPSNYWQNDTMDQLYAALPKL